MLTLHDDTPAGLATIEDDTGIRALTSGELLAISGGMPAALLLVGATGPLVWAAMAGFAIGVAVYVWLHRR